MIGFVGLATLVPISRAWLVSGERSADLLGSSAPWAFGFVLYPASGLAAWLVWRRVAVSLERKRAALRRWGWQLLLGGLWQAALYGTHSPALAAALSGLLLLAVAATMAAFWRLQASAAVLLAPYAIWLLWLAAAVAIAVAERFWPSGISAMMKL